ncbi:hypothetical protein FISHEDRAFT_41334 [Fistulina hepatica ATCC 64428]|nr:hypothetical protein FISHEDRAFT_41334 [Fistulina hepatica ATCC 64428]
MSRPLNVNGSSAPETPQAKDAPAPLSRSTSKSNKLLPSDISSPHELTNFVEALLEQLDQKFDTMSTQILDRMNQMSTRVDALETAIQDIINGDVGPIQSPSLPSTPGIRRSDSGQPLGL